MPEEFVRFGETWLEHHPGWTMRQWGETDLPPLRNQALYDSAQSFSERSDIIRFELLWLHGGVYVDADFECRKSIERLLRGVQIFASFESDDKVSGALMGSVPEHPFIEELIELLPASIKEHGSADPAVSTGPGHLTRALTAWDATGHDPVTLFPASYFYPYSWKEKYRRFERFDEAYAVHHWAGSWMQSSDSRLKQLAISSLMRSWLTRRVFYVNAWIKARAAGSA